MYLTLEVVSPQAASLGAQRRHVVGTNGLTIGRIEGNDWVIHDPYISKRHARISYADGGFTVEGLGKNPIAIARPENAIPGHRPYALKNGDHVFIDQYDILIGIFQGDPPGSPAPSDDPFGIMNAELDTGPVPTTEPAIPGAWEDGPLGNIADDSQNPLSVLPPAGGRPVPQPPAVNLQPDSPLREQFAPPPVRLQPPPPAAGSGAIPASWDQQVDASAASAPASIPTHWDRSISPPPAPPPPARPEISRPPPRPQLQPQPPRPKTVGEIPRVQSRPRPPLPPTPPPRELSRTAGSRTAVIPPPAAPTPAPTPTSAPAASLAATTGDPNSLIELLRGAGLSERDLTPEMMRELGQVLRIVVQGVMEVLHARADIKAQFRLPLTRMKMSENNPLKFSPNVESALHTFLVERNPGYITTVPAFEEAFADIRNHQMALLEGVRVAFASMLEAFDPEELRKGFDAVVKHGGRLAGVLGAKSKYWDLYVERFTTLQRDADDTFRRLFGDVFAEAYERQLERLKSLASQRNKN